MILITGGLGFLGSHVAERLHGQGHDLVLISRSRDKLRNISAFAKDVTLEVGDVTNFEWLQSTLLKHQPDAVLHFAGQLTSYESFERPLYDVDVNAKTTLAMLEAIRQFKKPCRFVLGSTFWVIGRPQSLPVSETAPCWPQNIYAADRLASEHYCSIYHRVYDLDTVVMRLTNTFGTREQHDNPRKAALNYLIHLGYKGEPVPIYGTGEFYRDYMYVTDAAAAAQAILERGESGSCYFVGTGVKTWFKDVGKWIEEFTSGKVWYKPPPDYHKRIDVGNFLVDNTRLRSLGWEHKVSVRDGIRLVVEHYRELGL